MSVFYGGINQHDNILMRPISDLCKSNYLPMNKIIFLLLLLLLNYSSRSYLRRKRADLFLMVRI